MIRILIIVRILISSSGFGSAAERPQISNLMFLELSDPNMLGLHYPAPFQRSPRGVYHRV